MNLSRAGLGPWSGQSPASHQREVTETTPSQWGPSWFGVGGVGRKHLSSNHGPWPFKGLQHGGSISVGLKSHLIRGKRSIGSLRRGRGGRDKEQKAEKHRSELFADLTVHLPETSRPHLSFLRRGPRAQGGRMTPPRPQWQRGNRTQAWGCWFCLETPSIPGNEMSRGARLTFVFEFDVSKQERIFLAKRDL